jgi:hypothetical protein
MASKSKRTKTTDTKSISLHGDEYWINAGKQIEWPIDLRERHISVPEIDLQRAKDNLMVQHFINNGFFIQLCIGEVSKKPIFDPVITLKQKPIERSEFAIRDRFRIKSTHCELEIAFLEGKKITLHYINRIKPDITSNVDNLRKVLLMEVWERI